MTRFESRAAKKAAKKVAKKVAKKAAKKVAHGHCNDCSSVVFGDPSAPTSKRGSTPS